MGKEKKKSEGFTLNKRNVEALPFTTKGERCHIDESLEGFGVRVGKTGYRFRSNLVGVKPN